MKWTVVLCVGACVLDLAACSSAVPAPGYTQSRAIDQDIDASHAGMPSLAAPTATAGDRDVSAQAWRNEEQIDRQREQTGQLPH